MKKLIFSYLILLTGTGTGYAQSSRTAASSRDSLSRPQGDTIVIRPRQVPGKKFGEEWLKTSLYPSASLQQDLKGRAAGLYIQEPSGEPGSYQYMFIRGVSAPLFSAEDLVRSQPLIVVDGLPLVSNEHPFAYDVQVYDYTRIGPSTNLLAGINLDNIESVAVMKDIADYAIYGPRAANGVIYIKTKGSQIRKRIDFDSYFGIAARPQVTTINGGFENKFRRRFYDRYASQEQVQNYATFLKDSMNAIYFGPSNWTDSYYRNALLYNANVSITGGSNRAHFKFGVGTQNNKGVADDTEIGKYNVNFVLNMKPMEWLNIIANVNASRLSRQRNRYNRDRFAEIRYLPELSQPLSPNKQYYDQFLARYANSIDNNFSNIVDGSFSIGIKYKGVNLLTNLGISYTDGQRDVFHPTTLMEGTKYISNYIGYNQRLVFDNKATYVWNINKDNKIDFELGQSIHYDTYRYNYAYAYGQGGSDYMKVNLLKTDPNNIDYLGPLALSRRLVFRFLDKTVNNLVSFYGKFAYSYKDRFTVTALLRNDGSSNAQPDNPWFFSPVISGSWNIREHLLTGERWLSTLNLRASYGRLGRMELNDRFAQGPQYLVDFGWTGEPLIQSYSSTVGLVRPYSKGYVGYGIPWSYNEQLGLGIDFGFLNNRITGSLELYSVTAKDQLIGIPSFAEYGYAKSFEPGMEVNNRGIDFTINASVLPAGKALQWTASLNANYNRNKLKALPRGMQALIVGDRLLKVGEPVDQFWLLENQGMYFTDDEVPVDPKNLKALNYKGIPLKAGDPIWVDQNGDHRIDNQDKVLKGQIMPLISGGFNNSFSYKGWSATVDFYFNIGRKIINQQMSDRFNFINRESSSTIQSVKEITFWEKQGDYDRYPLYNPWSNVIPYRVDQDLFLEDASFLKLRNVTLGYDLTPRLRKHKKKSGFNRCFLYLSAGNLFTLTPYTGRDPELVSYTGYDSGYGLPIPKTFVLGIKMSL